MTSSPAADLTERLAQIPRLSDGAHDEASGEMCVMEAVAFIAGEPWSDSPQCASPVIAEFMRSWNDALPDDERDALLRPLIPHLIGTRADDATEHRRALMAADWLVRVNTPAWLRLAGLTAQADALTSLPEITDMTQVPSIRPTIEAARLDADAARAAARAAARDAARAAVWAAVWAAAWAAAGAAAWAAARDAVWDAARAAAWAAARAAAWAAARDAARAAAEDAAWAAARGAARDALKSTRQQLQQSALGLVERMIEAKP